MFNSYTSAAELGRKRLLAMGLDSSVVIAIPAERVKIRRTISSVIKFREWLESSDVESSGVNIITTNTHSYRTWITYKKILDDGYNVGIIPVKLDTTCNHRYEIILDQIKECISVVFYWLILNH